MPGAGISFNAAKPFGMYVNSTPNVGEQNPGNLKYSGVMYPMHAIMEILPCLISVHLLR